MTGDGPWGGDALPEGLSREDRVGWEVVATVLVRIVPDPVTGENAGLSLEYECRLPKLLLVDQLMKTVADLMLHDDFQDGVELRPVRDEDEESDTDGR